MRKLLSVTCIASLLFSLVSPAFADPIPPLLTERPTSWGMLKSKFAKLEQGPSRRQLVDKAVLSNPFLNNPDIVSVQKLGPVEIAGYVAVGFSSGIPFVTFVDGNYHTTDTFIVEDYSTSEFSNFRIKEIQNDRGLRKIVLEQYEHTPDRANLQTEGIMDDL